MQAEPKSALIILMQICSIIPNVHITFLKKEREEKEQFGSIIHTPAATEKQFLELRNTKRHRKY